MSDFARLLLKTCSHVNHVAISGHTTPDYDSLCSSLAMQEILRQNMIKADVLLEKELDEYFYDFFQEFKFVTSPREYEAVISVDCSEKKRMPQIAIEALDKAKTSFLIDHHIKSERWTDFSQVEVGESSACEVIFRTFSPYFRLNAKLAKIFYIGIYSDTGGFVYSNMHPSTFEILARLIKFDIKPDEIVRECFEKVNKKAFEINKRALNSVKFYHNGEIAVSVLTFQDYEATKVSYNGSKFIVSHLQCVEGVKVAISVFEPEPKVYHISLRTAVDGVDVSKIANHFKGGGHMRASGMTLLGDLEKSINAVVKQTEYVLENGK